MTWRTGRPCRPTPGASSTWPGCSTCIPEVVVHDLHPEYLSTKHAEELHEQDPDLELVGLQHHHAHIASCLADNDHEGEAIGVAFDGLGYGPDATLWGCEVLVTDLHGYGRAAHLGPVPMPGGRDP